MASTTVKGRTSTGTPGKRRSPIVRSKDAAKLLALTGTVRLPDAEFAIAMFGFPLILTLGYDLDLFRSRVKDGRGRRAGFPTAALIAISAIARYTGSLPSALKVLRGPGVWDLCRKAWGSFADVAPLPPFPPERYRLGYLRDVINEHEEAMAALKESFTGGSVRMAQRLGNLTASEGCLLRVDPAHTIFGDGSNLRPMTDVMEHVNELTGEVEYFGSRATLGAPRVQKAVRELNTDHPGQIGINFVALHTETPFGLVTLGVESTLAAEQWAALTVLERIHAHAGTGVHTLVYDGALTGWVKDALFSTYGIQLLHKGRQRGEGGLADPEDKAGLRRESSRAAKDGLRILDIDGMVQAQAADRLAAREADHTQPSVERSTAYLDRVHSIVQGKVLERLWQSGAPLPVGTSLYPSARDDARYELVNGEYEFVDLTHTLANGTECTHELVIDDGALFTVDIDDHTEVPVKAEHLPCTNARRERTGSRFTLERSFAVPCPHGDVTWTHTWDPRTPIRTRGESRPRRDGFDRAGRFLSTVPRVATAEFQPVLRLRNYSESFNNWFKSAMPIVGRAASMTQAGQEFDFLMSAMAMNALAWHHANR